MVLEPLGLSHKYSQTVTSGLAKWDATRLNYLFHKLRALLQMLRSQHSTDPSAGFFKDIHLGLTRPPHHTGAPRGPSASDSLLEDLDPD